MLVQKAHKQQVPLFESDVSWGLTGVKFGMRIGTVLQEKGAQSNIPVQGGPMKRCESPASGGRRGLA